VRLGIAGILPRDPLMVDTAAVRRVCELGFRTVALNFGPATSEITKTVARRIRTRFEHVGVRPVELGLYHVSLIDSDPTVRARQVREVQRACTVAAWLGRPPVIIGSGSLNPKGQFLPHPDNHSEEVHSRLLTALREAVKAAEEEGVILSLEAHTMTTLKDPETVRSILEMVGSSALRVHVDPVNWVTFNTIYCTGKLLDAIFNTLPPHFIVGLHAKGVAIEDRLILHLQETYAGADDDRLDYRTFLRRAAVLGPDTDLVIEHTPLEAIPRARAYLLQIAKEVGVGLE
jgi:sugar phosphate isomerase/epimerase